MNTPVKKNDWRGYDFDQLVYHRLLTQARLEVEKARLTETVASLKQGTPFMSKGFTRRLFSAFTFVDYAVIAMKLFRKIKPLFSKK